MSFHKMISLELYSLPPYILGGPGLSYTNVHIKEIPLITYLNLYMYSELSVFTIGKHS